MRVGVAVAVLTAMTEAALPSSSGSVPVPIKKGAPVLQRTGAPITPC
jgi:hypothetical protein